MDDGFPPLIAALSCTREVPGANRRTDIAEIIRLLLAFGTDPNQRGIFRKESGAWKLLHRHEDPL